MSVAFLSIVELIRKSARKTCGDGELRLWVKAGQSTDLLLNAAYDWVAPTVLVKGREHFGRTDVLGAEEVEVVFRPVAGGRLAILRDVDELVSYQHGLYQYQPPDKYFLVAENYLSDDLPAPGSQVEKYRDAPVAAKLISSMADLISEGRPPVYVVLAEGRVDIPLRFSSADLSHLIPRSEIEDFHAEVYSAPLLAAKKRILKRIVRRYVENSPDEQRFGQVLRALRSIREAFRADFSLYESEFNFDKLREEFERKRVDYMLKLNASTTDALSKLLAIPVAQGLLVSQMKPADWFVNAALLAASAVFAVTALLVLINQYSSAEHLANEIKIEIDALKNKYPDQYSRLNSAYRILQRRAATTVVAPFVLGGLLALFTGFTFFSFFKISERPAAEAGKQGVAAFRAQALQNSGAVLVVR